MAAISSSLARGIPLESNRSVGQLPISWRKRHVEPDFQAAVMLQEDRHPYVHGGGFGIATEILADRSLAFVLMELEERRLKQCLRILNQQKRVLNATAARKITLAMENSPVVAALAQVKFGPIPLEWDLWLDPQEPQFLEKAVIEHGSVCAMLFGKLPCIRSYFLKGAPSVTSWVEIYHKALGKFYELSKHHVTQLPPVCLDIKSTWSTAKDINLFINNLKQTLHVEVRYVGSFSYRQIAEIQGAEKILFCHAVRDLKRTVASTHFPKFLMLNGADLLEQTNLEALRAIAKTHQLSIGIYVQEPEAGTDAIKRLIAMVNAEPQLFSLGFALGNSRDGRAARMIKGSGAGVQKFLLTNSVLFRMPNIIVRVSLLVLGLLALLWLGKSRKSIF